MVRAFPSWETHRVHSLGRFLALTYIHYNTKKMPMLISIYRFSLPSATKNFDNFYDSRIIFLFQKTFTLNVFCKQFFKIKLLTMLIYKIFPFPIKSQRTLSERENSIQRTSLLRSAVCKLKILFTFFTKQSTLTRRSMVLGLPFS